MPRSRETKKYFQILLVTTSLVILFPSQNRQEQIGGVRLEVPPFPLAADRQIPVPQADEGVPDLIIGASSVLVKDKNSGLVLFEKNAKSSLPIASLTKLLSALVVYKRLGLEETVKILPEDTAVPPFKIDLISGEELQVRQLLAAILISSANDATYALARKTAGSVEEFVGIMNWEAKNLKMRATAFTNPAGFDDLGHYSTAWDLALLVEEFLAYPELVAMTGLERLPISSIDGKYSHQLLTTNKLLAKNNEIIGLKTGFTTEARGSLIILVDHGSYQYYMIILGSNEREKDAEAIHQWVEENFAWN